MKKLALTLGIIIAVSVSVSSCKSHEKCAAYSKIEMPKVSKKSV